MHLAGRVRDTLHAHTHPKHTHTYTHTQNPKHTHTHTHTHTILYICISLHLLSLPPICACSWGKLWMFGVCVCAWIISGWCVCMPTVFGPFFHRFFLHVAVVFSSNPKHMFVCCPPPTTASLLLAFGLVKWLNQTLHAAANEIGQFGLNACLTDPALSCLIKLTSLVHPLLSHVPPSV